MDAPVRAFAPLEFYSWAKSVLKPDTYQIMKASKRTFEMVYLAWKCRDWPPEQFNNQGVPGAKRRHRSRGGSAGVAKV